MNKCGDPFKCLLSLTATGCVCSLHTLRAISFISVLTYFSSGRCVSVLCQSLFVSWWVCGMAVRLGLRLGRAELGAHLALAHQPVVFAKASGCRVRCRDVTHWCKLSPNAWLDFCLKHLFVWLLAWFYLLVCFVLGFCFVSLVWFGFFFTAVCALKYHPRRWYVNCFRLLKNQWYSTSQPLLHVSWLNRSMDTAKKGFLALEKRYFCASKGGCLKIIQNCRELNWFLLKVGTDLTVKWRISPTAFQHLQ